MVVPVRHSLTNNITVTDDDSEAIKGRKSMPIQQLDHHYVINELHDSASLLDPRLKHNNSIMPADRRDVALNCIRRIMSEVPADFEEAYTSYSASKTQPLK